MPLDHEPEQSMEEIVEEEIREDFERSGYNDKYKQHAHMSLVNFFDHFPINIMQSMAGEVGMETLSGRSPKQVAQDIVTAIKTSGVDMGKLEEYVKSVCAKGLVAGNNKSHRELILPVYIKLREMGYTEADGLRLR